ncbi:hypothetical protein VRU48_17120 [Pedobacter sp. KR3-3]|uniref:O-antigen ligase domain-containing protein n=1 Tax=Pedobacter albus TaxID=3113905 RepID=A0ABU7IBI2_9SPHI|nr:hypothetical protein [Pedobacter sp. KR3-3]MEE1946850.1 hypothetical protein [Pedobacter sp. KR3-3]
MKKLIYLYVLAMPFVSAFAISEHLNISLLISVFMLAMIPLDLYFTKKINRTNIKMHSIFILCFLITILFSYTLNSFGDQTTTNHLFAYLTIFSCSFLSVQYWLLKNCDDQQFYRRLLFFITLSIVVSSVYGCVEYFMAIRGTPIDNYIPRVAVQEYDADGLGDVFRTRRIRGFAEESGHFAFMLEILAPLAIFYLFYSGYSKMKLIIKVAILLLLIATLLFTLSTAAFLIIPVAIFLSCCLYWRKVLRNIKSILIKLIPVFVVLGLLLAQLPLKLLIELAIGSKFDSSSADERSGRFTSFIETFPNSRIENLLIGYGPSGYKTAGLKDAFLSLIPTILFESGIIGLLFFISALAYVFYQLLAIKSKINFFLAVGFISGFLHYIVIANYWYPWFWFLCVFIIYFKQKEEREQIFND